LFSRYDRQTVIAAAERILQRIGGYEFRMVPGEADRHAITASGGLAFLRPKSTAEDSMRQADIAMYEAKGKGRNRLVLYDQLQESMDDGDQGRRKCLPPGRRSQITHALFEVGGQYRRSM
jgi:predicted signal transduction protein with EAL and GGDEF domain